MKKKEIAVFITPVYSISHNSNFISQICEFIDNSDFVNHNCKFISHKSDFVTRKREFISCNSDIISCNCEFKSCNTEKKNWCKLTIARKSQNCDIKSCNYIFFYYSVAETSFHKYTGNLCYIFLVYGNRSFFLAA